MGDNKEEINYLDLIKNYKSKKNRGILDKLDQQSKSRNTSVNQSQNSRANNDRRSAASKGRNDSQGRVSSRRSGSRGKSPFDSSQNTFTFSRPVTDSSILDQVARDRKTFERKSLMEKSREVENLKKKKQREFHSKFEKNIREVAKEFEFKEEKSAKMCFNFTLYLFIFASLLLTVCFLSHYLRAPGIKYCDTNDSRSRDCTTCPPIAICKNGAIQRCISHTHKLKGGKCVYSKEEFSREMKFANQLVRILARKRGDSLCYGGSYTMTKLEVEKFFKNKFADNGWDFRDTYRWLNIMSGNEFSAMGLKVEQKPNFIIYSEIPQPSLTCSINLFIAKNKFLVSLMGVILVFLGYILVRLKMKLRVFDQSREAFEEAIIILRETGNRELPRLRLVERLQERGFLTKDYHEIMNYFDLIRENDERMGIGIMTVNGIRDYYYFLC